MAGENTAEQGAQPSGYWFWPELVCMWIVVVSVG